MPVYDLGYRKYEGALRSRAVRWTPIARTSFRNSVNKAFVMVLVAAGIPFLMYTLYVYAAGTGIKQFIQLPMAQGFADGTAYELISSEIFFAVMLLAVSCGGIIADDLRTGALQIYFSRPITQADYVLGKLCAVTASACFVTLLPGLMLFFMMMAFAPDLGFLADDPLMPLKIIAYSLLVSVVLGSILLALSSLGRQGRGVGIMFAGAYFFTFVLSQVLSGIFRDDRWEVVHIGESLKAAGRSLFSCGEMPSAPADLAWGVLGGLVFLSLLVLARRADAVEVVK